MFENRISSLTGSESGGAPDGSRADDGVFAVVRRVKIPYRLVLAVTLLTIAFALTEGAGIGMLLPILVYVETGAESFVGGTNAALGALGQLLEALRLPVNFITLIALAVIPLLMRQMVYYFKSVYTAKAQHEYLLKLRTGTIESFMKAGLPFYIRNTHGEVISTLLVDASQASTIVMALVDIIGCTLLLMAYVAIASVLSPLLTLTAAPVFVFCAWVIRFQLVRGRNFGRLITDNNKAFTEIVSEAFRGIRLIKMRSMEEGTASHLQDKAANVARSTVDLQKVRSGLEATAQPILILGTFGVLYIAVQQMEMRLAELGMFLFLIARATPLLIQINTSRLLIHSSVESHLRIDRMREAAAATPEVDTGTKPFRKLKDGISFHHVSFSYSRDNVLVPALHDVSFTIPKGSTVALVGPSGAGKSTLVDLIPRFYEPSGGMILIDGQPIESYDVLSLRRRTAFVTQESVLFHDTIRGNIEMGLDAPLSDAKLRACLECSHCAEFVDRLPRGVETAIGERGMQISGGQRQRLVLARALAQDPEILILDEPTSALDSISEAEIQASLENLRGRITMIIIVHRLATIRNADSIVVLEDGEIVGMGTHDTLIDDHGPYRTLVELQRL